MHHQNLCGTIKKLYKTISNKIRGGKLVEKEENILGYERIGKLMRKFSIPCIISLVVNSLYNIVDQIFIGWGVVGGSPPRK